MLKRFTDLSESICKSIEQVNKMHPVLQLSLVVATPVVAATTLVYQHQEHKHEVDITDKKQQHEEKGWAHEEKRWTHEEKMLNTKQTHEEKMTNKTQTHETTTLNTNIKEKNDQRAHEIVVLEKKKWWPW